MKSYRIYWDTFKYKYIRPPKGQFPVGSRVYKGFQGSGKTLSMAKYAYDISQEFPEALIYANFYLRNIPNFVFIDTDERLVEALSVSRGSKGVLVLLDEAHLYFNKKTGISLDVLTAISQQRKDRRRIVFSSQIWEELDISLRKQVKEIVSCRCLFHKFQINSVLDGESLHWDKKEGGYIANPIRDEIFKHSEFLYSLYDTYQKIVTNKDYSRNYTINNNNGVPPAVPVEVKLLKR